LAPVVVDVRIMDTGGKNGKVDVVKVGIGGGAKEREGGAKGAAREEALAEGGGEKDGRKAEC